MRELMQEFHDLTKSYEAKINAPESNESIIVIGGTGERRYQIMAGSIHDLSLALAVSMVELDELRQVVTAAYESFQVYKTYAATHFKA